MAKISAHGREIGTVYLTTKAKRYMSDGNILVNQGFGWKIGGKVKAGCTPEISYQNQVAFQQNWERENPSAAEYRRQLHSLCGMGKRWKLHMAVAMMPDDPDGVWSETCDSYGDNISADIDDIVQLCRAYKAAILDAKIKRELRAKLEAVP